MISGTRARACACARAPINTSRDVERRTRTAGGYAADRRPCVHLYSMCIRAAVLFAQVALYIPLPAAGEDARVEPCDAGSTAQAWLLRSAPPAAWGQPATLVNTESHPADAQCLDVADRAKGPGRSVRSWNCCCTGLVDTRGRSVCGDPESGKPPCGDTKDNYNQIWELSAQGHLTTGKVMGELCLDFSPSGTLETSKCSASSPKWIYNSTKMPPLRLLFNQTMCLSAAPSGGSPRPPHPDPERPVTPVPQACTSTNTTSLPFCNSSLSTEKRVADLLSRLATDEKLTQLIGGIGGGVTPGVRDLFPPYQYHSEGLHGLRSTCGLNKAGPAQQPGKLYSTLFPQVTAMAATGNLSLIKDMAAHMGDEARAVNNYMQGNTVGKGGGLDYWGPTMNIGRDRESELPCHCSCISCARALHIDQFVEDCTAFVRQFFHYCSGESEQPCHCSFILRARSPHRPVR